MSQSDSSAKIALDRYVELALKEFGFLITEFKFREPIVDFAGNRIVWMTYLSSTVFVTLVHGTPDFGIDFFFGQIGKDDKQGAIKFNPFDLFHLSDHPIDSNYEPRSAFNEKSLKLFLPIMAKFLYEYGGDCLRGDEKAFELMRSKRDAQLVIDAEQEERTRISRLATDAWSKKDFAKVVTLLEPEESRLTELELGRLAYSKKQIASRID